MVRTDFSKTKHLFLSYPKKFYNEYEALIPFYNELIELIPNDIHQFIITSTKQVAQEVKDRFPSKNLIPINIKNWDEIWLRDCMGLVKENEIIKPLYYPNYCNLKSYWNYFKGINNLSKQIIKESLDLEIIDLPLILDGGNFINNSTIAFLTEKVVEDNPGKKIEEMIADYCDLKAVILPKNHYDTIGHADGYMAFKDEKSLFLSRYPNLKYLQSDIEYIDAVKMKVEDLGLGIIPIYDRPIDEPVACGCKRRKNQRSCYYSAAGTYINFIQLNNTIILPEYSLPNKRGEIDYFQKNKQTLIDNGFSVISINCDQLAKFGGSLHCLSWQC